MKSTELRIGNLLNFHGGVRPVTAYEIYKLNDGACYDEYPIPLTPEWLTKFGFKENVSWYLENETPYNFVYVTSGKMYYNGLHIDCQYVHQLQNLYFALIGKELILTP